MSITNKLNQIKNALYGKEVRGAIHDAIKQVYDDASVNHDNANMEVKIARGTHNTLNDRLDNVDEIQARTNAQLSINKNNLQHQINNLILESGGDSNLEIIQSRIGVDGNVYETLNSRINAIETGVKTNKSPIFIEFERGNIDVANGNLHDSTTVLRTKEFCKFNAKKIYINIGEGYRCRTIAFNSNKEYLWYGEWLETSASLKIEEGNFYKFIISKISGESIVVDEFINIAFQYDYGVYDYPVDLSSKIDAPVGYQNQFLELKEGYVHGTNNVDYGGEEWDYAYAFYNCIPNETIRITGDGQSVVYPVIIFYDENNNKIGTYGEVNTGYTDHELIIPEGCYKLCLNSKDKKSIKLESMQPYVNLDEYLENYMSGQLDNNELYFEIDNIYKRIERNEKVNDFAWKPFDKTYFAFVIDDCNSSLPYFQELFTELSVPLSSATIIDKLNTTYQTSSGNKTVKEILDLIVANGGEVLAHYNGSLNDSSSDSDWLKVTREVKKTLTQSGYDVRGLIRADSTSNGSYKGEKYCRLYFDYSDGVGSSPQYDIKRWFLMGTTTLEGMKAYIDQCAERPGFYPIAFHGNRGDEPMATTENMMEVIKYIKSLGDNVEITTYRNVYDRFASSVLENRLSVVEKFLGTIG